MLKFACILVLLFSGLACGAKRADTRTDVCLLSSDLVLEKPLRVASWNAQRFGRAKVAKPLIPQYMAQIMVLYDIVVLQEVTDSSQESIYDFLHILNHEAHLQSPSYNAQDSLRSPIPDLYDVVVSDRVGTALSSYREQYVFYYRPAVAVLSQTYQYVDTNATFKYEPFVAVFNTTTLDIDQLAFVAIHTTPESAEVEIDALVDVHDTVLPTTGVQDVVILGDFNAGCSYVTENDWQHIRLFTEPRFHWLISSHVDTTTKSTTCPYDRIVISGPQITEIAYKDSAQAFHFDDYLGLTNTSIIQAISDHFPVEFLIRGKVKTQLQPSLSINVDIDSNTLAVKELYEACRPMLRANKKRRSNSPGENLCGATPQSISKAKDILIITFITNSTDETVQLLKNLETQHRCLVNEEVRTILEYKLLNEVLRDASLYLEPAQPQQELTILCRRNQCKISVEAHVNIV